MIRSGPPFISALLIAFLCMSGLYITGCDDKGKVSLAAVEPPMRTALDRLDKYLAADTKITPTEKEVALRTNALLRKTLDTAMQRPAPTAKISSNDKGRKEWDTNGRKDWNVDKTGYCARDANGRCKMNFVDLNGPMPKRGEVLSDQPKPQTMVSSAALAKEGLFFSTEMLLIEYLQENPDVYKREAGKDILEFIYTGHKEDPSANPGFNDAFAHEIHAICARMDSKTPEFDEFMASIKVSDPSSGWQRSKNAPLGFLPGNATALVLRL